MKKLKLFTGIFGMLLVTPMWYYLMYKILEGVHASELMWFLYWVYVPLGIVIGVLMKIAEAHE